MNKLFLISLVFLGLNGSILATHTGDPAELCTSTVVDDKCTETPVQGAVWHHPDQRFYIVFYLEDGTHIWAEMKPAAEGTYRGRLFFNMYASNEKKFSVSGTDVPGEAGWIRFDLSNDDNNAEKSYFFRSIPS